MSLTVSEDALAMPQHRLAPLALTSLIALASIQLSGCTAIGFGIGALVDAPNGKGPPGRLTGVSTGTLVTLSLHDGRKLQGRVLGSTDSLSEVPPPVPPSGGRLEAPLRAVLLLGTSDGVQQIPIENVKRVSVPDARGKAIGVLSGLALDVIFIWWLNNSLGVP